MTRTYAGCPRLSGIGGVPSIDLALAGCQTPLVITALGAGASAGIARSINGVATRTFAAPPEQVAAALQRLGMRYETITEKSKVRLVRAEAGQARAIEIEFQELTYTATQIRVAVKTGGLLYDRAAAESQGSVVRMHGGRIRRASCARR